VLLRPLPYIEPDRLVSIWLTYSDRKGQPGWDHGWVSFGEFVDARAQQTSFESLALTSSGKVSLLSAAEPQRIDVGYASWTLFRRRSSWRAF